jgi:PhnB protein
VIVKLNPYLSFSGNCEEAFRLYENVLGGKITYIGRYKDMPGDHGLPPDSVMHVTLVIGDQTLQGADSPPSQYQTPKGTARRSADQEYRRSRARVRRSVAGRISGYAVAGNVLGSALRHVPGPLRTPWLINCEKPA